MCASVVSHRAGVGRGRGWRGLVTLLRSPALCVEQGCVHWCLPGSPSQQCGVSQPIPPGSGMSLHSAPGERLVKGAAGRLKDRLPQGSAWRGAKCWHSVAGGQAGRCARCAGMAAVLTHPQGWSHPAHSCSPWPRLLNLLPCLHPAKHTLSWFLEP